MSFSNVYDDFCKTAESLLQVMQMEGQYLQNTQLTQLDSLWQKKAELFARNQDYADQVLVPMCWEQLDQSQQQNASRLLRAVVFAMKENISLLDVSRRGNKRLMDLYFHKKLKSTFYTASGQLLKTSYAPSVGVQYMV